MFKIDSHVKPPRIKKPKSERTPDNVGAAIKAHAEAYKAVFGITPTYVYNVTTKFVRISGGEAVSLQRLKELTRMLKMRAGT